MKIANLILRILYEVIKAILMRPGAFHLQPAQLEWGNKAKKSFLEIEGIAKRVCLYEYGDGPVLLLIHGWGGCGLQLSPLIQPLMSLGYKIVLFDAPGHGESSGIGATYLEFVRALSQLAKHYSDVRGVVAHSMGGGAAIVLASQLSRPEFKTVLMAPHYDMQAEFKDWAKSSRGLGYVLDIYVRISERLFKYKLSEINPKNLLITQKGAFLLIHDVEDQASKYVNSELLHKYLPNSKILKTVGKGHNRILNDAEVLDVVKLFFVS
ncbi:MAG: hypothetical protein A2X86_05245 [Bdellovibrionales bacterium GWA2_49_15]|nr:MAG: hypothetical protein A2X86_05245 [Bdellovibrionales bacterium GWA2_49_15]